MQNTAHIIDFYWHKACEAVAGRAVIRNLPNYTRQHDAYLIEHDKSVTELASDLVDVRRLDARDFGVSPATEVYQITVKD